MKPTKKKHGMLRMNETQRLSIIELMIKGVDRRCRLSNEPINRTDEIKESELRRIYLLAKGDRRVC